MVPLLPHAQRIESLRQPLWLHVESVEPRNLGRRADIDIGGVGQNAGMVERNKLRAPNGYKNLIGQVGNTKLPRIYLAQTA